MSLTKQPFSEHLVNFTKCALFVTVFNTLLDLVIHDCVRYVAKSYQDACKVFKSVQKSASALTKSLNAVDEEELNADEIGEEQTTIFAKVHSDCKQMSEQIEQLKAMLKGMKKFLDSVTSSSSK